MIDQTRIEVIKAMPVAKAKAAMKEYAAELGVKVTAKTIDNMVSEISAQSKAPDARAKTVELMPKAIKPIVGSSFSLYAKLIDFADPSTCKFQWSFKGGVDGDFVDIPGARSQTLKVIDVDAADIGEYKCTVTDADGAETASDAEIVSEPVDLPEDFPKFRLYRPVDIEFYGRSFASVSWAAISKMAKILDGDNANNPDEVHAEMAKDPDTLILLNLLVNSPELVATDTRDGYRWIISATNDKDNKTVEIGRFVNV